MWLFKALTLSCQRANDRSPRSRRLPGFTAYIVTQKRGERWIRVSNPPPTASIATILWPNCRAEISQVRQRFDVRAVDRAVGQRAEISPRDRIFLRACGLRDFGTLDRSSLYFNDLAQSARSSLTVAFDRPKFTLTQLFRSPQRRTGIAKDAGNLAALLIRGAGVLKDVGSSDISLPADTINSGSAFPESPPKRT